MRLFGLPVALAVLSTALATSYLGAQTRPRYNEDPTRPTPIRPAPSQPAPNPPAQSNQPTPSQPAPSQPAASQPAPSQPAPSQPPASQPAPAPPAASAGGTMAQTPTPAQLLNIGLTMHQVIADRAQLAQSKATSPTVKQFADQMVAEHTLGVRTFTNLAASQRLTPADSDATRALKAQSTSAITSLSRLTGTAFDRAYADFEAAFHQSVLNFVSQVTTTNVSNASVKSAIQSMNTKEGLHMQRVKQLQAQMPR